MWRIRGFRAACFAVAAAVACALAHIAPAQAQAQRVAGGTPVTLVALGDSLMAGYGVGQAQALPAVLEALLKAKGRNVTIVNAGVSGDTSSAGLDRLDWSVPDGTSGVIVALGANDMLRALDPAVPKKALTEIVARLKARNIPVMLAGMQAAPNLGADYARAFNAIFPDLASAEGLVLYPFLLDGVAADRALNQPDGLHPTAKGIALMAERMLPKVEEFLDRIGR